MINRSVMKFLVPLTVESLGRNDLTGRAIVPFYISPQSFDIQDNKIISETLTKGGYAVQYWGEQLGEIQASGTTGSGGIEAINILRAVYRNEIIQFNKILLERAKVLDQTAREALQDSSTAGIGSGIVAILDEITQDGFSGIIDGTKSVIEEITQAAKGISDSNPNSVQLIPTIGAFATSMILYFQGEKFTGYFKNFKSSENADSAGLFNYQFTFTIIKRSGTRTNFMPWHRKPTDASRIARSASLPLEGVREDELTFQTSRQTFSTTQQSITGNLNLTNSITTSFPENQQSTEVDINKVNINRSSFLKGR